MELLKKGYPISELELDMIVADDISVKDPLGVELFSIAEGTSLTKTLIEKLGKHNIHFVNIYTGSFGEEATSNIEELEFLSDSDLAFISALPTEETKKFMDNKIKSILLENIRSSFETAKTNAPIDSNTRYRVAKNIDDTVDMLINMLATNPESKIHVSDIKSYDDYVFHHCLSVATLSLAIGKEMGFGFWILRKLGRAAVMHDIGKMKLSESLLLKSDTFTPQDYLIVKEHSQFGANQIRKLGIADNDIRDAILHHHEKYNGTGYPSKLVGDKIPLFSRIISVADVFDALTSQRPHRDALHSQSDVIEIIMSETNVSFDMKVVQAFLNILDIYPVGSMVSLSDNRMAFVHAKGRHPLRPVIKIIDTGEQLDLGELRNLKLVITEIKG